MGFDEWVEYGLEHGFLKSMFDWVEDGPELSPDELERLENGDVVELTCARLYRDQA